MLREFHLYFQCYWTFFSTFTSIPALYLTCWGSSTCILNVTELSSLHLPVFLLCTWHVEGVPPIVFHVPELPTLYIPVILLYSVPDMLREFHLWFSILSNFLLYIFQYCYCTLYLKMLRELHLWFSILSNSLLVYSSTATVLCTWHVEGVPPVVLHLPELPDPDVLPAAACRYSLFFRKHIFVDSPPPEIDLPEGTLLEIDSSDGMLEEIYYSATQCQILIHQFVHFKKLAQRC